MFETIKYIGEKFRLPGELGGGTLGSDFVPFYLLCFRNWKILDRIK